MGKYFALEQGFEVDVSNAIMEHYLPTGINSRIPKKPYSIALALADKIDTLVGFFGINQKRIEKHKKDIVIMHPGPINRGVEIDSAVADGQNAIILDQVLNGVASRMAILFLLCGGKK